MKQLRNIRNFRRLGGNITGEETEVNTRRRSRTARIKTTGARDSKTRNQLPAGVKEQQEQRQLQQRQGQQEQGLKTAGSGTETGTAQQEQNMAAQGGTASSLGLQQHPYYQVTSNNE